MTKPALSHPSLLPLDGGINFRDLGVTLPLMLGASSEACYSAPVHSIA